MREEEEEKEKLALVLAAKSRSLAASPSVSASPIHTLASVPFCWEEQPGKPKNPLLPLSYPKCLHLPPRLLLPDQMPLPERKHGLFMFLRRRRRGDAVIRGSFVFPSENNMKMIKFERSGSLSGGGSVKGTQVWGSLCKGLKKSMAWKKKNKKLTSATV